MTTDVGTIPASSNSYATTTKNNLTIHKVPNATWMDDADLRGKIESYIANAGANELFIINADKEKYVNVAFSPSYEPLADIVTRVLLGLTLENNTVTTATFNEDSSTLTFSNMALSNLISINSASSLADTSINQNLILNNSSTLSGTLQTNNNNDNIADNYKVIEEWKYNLG